MKDLITRDNLVARGFAIPSELEVRPPVTTSPKMRLLVRSKRNIIHRANKPTKGGMTSFSAPAPFLVGSTTLVGSRSPDETESDHRSVRRTRRAPAMKRLRMQKTPQIVSFPNFRSIWRLLVPLPLTAQMQKMSKRCFSRN